MARYILTGTPGCGKTSIIRTLALKGISVVSEAATDIIADKQMQGDLTPWQQPDFIDDIIRLQKYRQINSDSNDSKLYFYDRSPICTYALAIYLGFKLSSNLMAEIERIDKASIYEKRVFFIENLGFITNTAARKISFAESLRFEQVHREAYAKFDYQCVAVSAAPIAARVKIILQSVENDARN